MGAITQEFVVHYEDGTSAEVVTDQRDFAMWEIQPFGLPFGDSVRLRFHLFARWCAWHALKRTKQTGLKWEDFNDIVVEVEPKDEPEEPDPGEPTAPDEG